MSAGDSLPEPKKLLEHTVGFTINYEREDPYDTRELSEIPDIRLWFVRLDASYPWFPVVLDWRAGELARYAAMLVPHQVMSVFCKEKCDQKTMFPITPKMINFLAQQIMSLLVHGIQHLPPCYGYATK